MTQWLAKYWLEAIFGLLISGLGVAVKWLHKKSKTEAQRQDAIEKGLQALLRSQMINDYNHYKEKEYAPIYAKDNFENVWKQYHNLGVNGVMDSIHEEFMSLPTTKEE